MNADELDTSDEEDNADDYPPAGRPRPERFTEASQSCFKKVKAVTAVIALSVFVTVVLVPPMTLVKVDCIQDHFMLGLQSHYEYF